MWPSNSDSAPNIKIARQFESYWAIKPLLGCEPPSQLDVIQTQQQL